MKTGRLHENCQFSCWKLLKSTGFHEIHQFSWNLLIFSSFQHENWQFSVKICSFYTGYWKDFCLGVFPSTFSGFHTENQWFWSENQWFLWNLADFMKTSSFHVKTGGFQFEIWQFSQKSLKKQLILHRSLTLSWSFIEYSGNFNRVCIENHLFSWKPHERPIARKW